MWILRWEKSDLFFSFFFYILREKFLVEKHNLVSPNIKTSLTKGHISIEPILFLSAFLTAQLKWARTSKLVVCVDSFLC